MKTGIVKRVIVISQVREYEPVVKAFRGGAFDFIGKPYNKEVLQNQILNCMSRLIKSESDQIFDDRFKHLIPYAEKGLIHRFTATFSTLMNSVTNATGEIEKYARERYGIDPERDLQDALIQQLRGHKESVSKARQEWTKLQALSSGSDENPQTESIEDMLNEINQKLLPCLTVKKTRLLIDLPESSWPPILTFQQDVQAVLKEIIIGGLSELPDYGDENNIKVSIAPDEMRVVVRLEDDLAPIAQEDADRINEGYTIVPDPKLGRKWGLSVAQHIALRGGGELILEPKTHGNIITYRIPLAHHA
jgi:hypothetical protein